MKSVWTASALSAVGTRMQFFVLAYLLTENSRGATSIGLVLGAAWVGRALMLLVSGELIQRLGPKRVLAATSIAQIFPPLVLALLFFLTDGQNLAPIIAIETIAGALTGIELPARFVLLQVLAPKERAQQVALLGTASNTIGIMLGPLLAAISLWFLPPLGVFLLNAFTFLVVGIASATSSPMHQLTANRTQKRYKTIIQGFQELFRVPLIQPFLLLSYAGAFFLSPIGASLAPMAQLELNANSWDLMLLTSAYGLGATIAMLGGKFVISRRPVDSLLGMTVLMGSLLAVLYSQSSSIVVALVFVLIFGIFECFGVQGGPAALLQSRADRDQLGRVTSASMFLWNLLFGFGNMVLGFMGDSLGIRTAIIVSAGLFAVFLMILKVLNNRDTLNPISRSNC